MSLVELPAVGELEPAPDPVAERRADVWLRVARGETQVSISKALGVSRATIQKDIAAEAKNRLSKLDNIDIELEKIIGTLEAVVAESWQAHREVIEKSSNSLAASNYLRLVLDAAREIARLRGFDALVARRGGGESGPNKTEVVIRIGGAKDFEAVVTAKTEEAIDAEEVEDAELDDDDSDGGIDF